MAQKMDWSGVAEILGDAGLEFAGAGVLSAFAAAGGAGAAFGQRFNACTEASLDFDVASVNDPASLIAEAAARIGRLEFAGDDEQGSHRFFVIGTRAGWLNLNPAYVIVALAGERLRAVAVAREGLISQRTAEGAVRRFAEAIGLLEFRSR